MKLLAMLLLSGNLFFANSEAESVEPSVEPTEEISEIVSEEISEEVSDEVVEQEQTELQKLLEQWINGEIELDDVTLETIYEKLGAVKEEDINKMLESYIEDAEERNKVASVISAVLSALLVALVVAIYLNKIKKQGLTATLNNETFSKSAAIMKTTVEKLENDVKGITTIVQNNNDRVDNLIEAIKKSSELTENQLKGVIGVLKIHYKGVDEDEQGKDTQAK